MDTRAMTAVLFALLAMTGTMAEDQAPNGTLATNVQPVTAKIAATPNTVNISYENIRFLKFFFFRIYGVCTFFVRYRSVLCCIIINVSSCTYSRVWCKNVEIVSNVCQMFGNREENVLVLNAKYRRVNRY